MKKSKKLLVFLLCLSLVVIATCVVVFGEDGGEVTPEPTAVPDHICGNLHLERVKDHIEPTCTEGGYELAEWTCSVCGKYMGEYRSPDGRPALGHTWATRIITGECAGGDGEEQYCTVCGVVGATKQASGHNWVTQTRKAQKCNEKAGTWEECTKCGAKRNEQYNGTVFTHTYTDETKKVITKEATCTSAGMYTQECDCGAKTVTYPIAKLPHTWVEGGVEPATCKSAGYTYKECSVCGTREKEQILAKKDHEWSEPYEDPNAPSGCTHTGTMLRKCTMCGMVDPDYRGTSPMKEHIKSSGWEQGKGEYASSHVKTCIVCRQVLESEAHIPDSTKAKCGDQVTCTVCGYVIEKAKSHQMVWEFKDNLVHMQKCSVCGFEGSTSLHSTVVNGDCTQSITCSVCNHAVAPHSAHTFSEWSVSGGVSTRHCTCAGCNYTETVTPTAEPTATPTVAPTATPTVEPTATPTVEPTATPTATPTAEPTATPTVEPTATPTVEPTATPTTEPIVASIAEPTDEPAATAAPTTAPTAAPAATPTTAPTDAPTATLTTAPTVAPTAAPTTAPTAAPTTAPTVAPTAAPTTAPTVAPTTAPTVAPTAAPTTAPTAAPTAAPTTAPTVAATAAPTTAPTVAATATPKPVATHAPTATPKATATHAPTATPKAAATHAPTATPKATTTHAPTATPKPTTAPASTTAPTATPHATTAPLKHETETPNGQGASEPVATTPASTNTPAPTQRTTVVAASPTPTTSQAVTSEEATQLLNSAISPLMGDVALDVREITNVTVTSDAQSAAAVAVHAAVIPETARERANETLAAFTVDVMSGSVSASSTDMMKISMPLEALQVVDEAFKLVRVDQLTSDLIEVLFTCEDGILSFEMNGSAVYLIMAE